MQVEVKWTGERTFIGETGTGNTVTMGITERNGTRIVASPMELVLLGAGGCTSVDVVSILEKSRQPIDGCSVKLSADRDKKDPGVFTRIHMHFILKGIGLDSDKIERAINLSADKYCSATAMLGKTAKITHDFEIIN